MNNHDEKKKIPHPVEWRIRLIGIFVIYLYTEIFQAPQHTIFTSRGKLNSPIETYTFTAEGHKKLSFPSRTAYL